MKMTQSTLGEYLHFEKSIDSIGIKARALEDTELHFSVYMSEDMEAGGNPLKVYSAAVHLFKSKDFHWMDLPINIYTDSKDMVIELENNPNVEVDQETWLNAEIPEMVH